LGAPRLTRRGVDVIRHMLPSPEGLAYAASHCGRCVACGTACGDLRSYVVRYSDASVIPSVGLDTSVLCQRCAAFKALTGGLRVR